MGLDGWGLHFASSGSFLLGQCLDGSQEKKKQLQSILQYLFSPSASVTVSAGPHVHSTSVCRSPGPVNADAHISTTAAVDGLIR